MGLNELEKLLAEVQAALKIKNYDQASVNLKLIKSHVIELKNLLNKIFISADKGSDAVLDYNEKRMGKELMETNLGKEISSLQSQIRQLK